MKRYRLVEQLGAGSSATVWRALDESRGHEVALKLLRQELGQDSTAVAWLHAEASASAALRHPGILRLVDQHLDGPQPALAFEYVPGETLARRLARKGRLEPCELADIGAQAADALVHVHERGLVHRDVKPSNILLGADGLVRLLDFGTSARAGVAPPNEPGTAVGTLPYVAPEQLAGQQPQPASDVYALGAVLYQAVSGRPPFVAHDPPALARAQQTPPAVVAGDGRALSTVALAALNHDPRRRPSMAHLAAQLRSLASGSGGPRGVVLSGVGAGTSRPVADRRRALHWPVAGAAGALAAVVLAAALALPSQPDSATSPGASPVLLEPADAFVEPVPAPAEVVTVDVPLAPDSEGSDPSRAGPREEGKDRADRGKGKPDHAGKGKGDRGGR